MLLSEAFSPSSEVIIDTPTIIYLVHLALEPFSTVCFFSLLFLLTDLTSVDLIYHQNHELGFSFGLFIVGFSEYIFLLFEFRAFQPAVRGRSSRSPSLVIAFAYFSSPFSACAAQLSSFGTSLTDHEISVICSFHTTIC